MNKDRLIRFFVGWIEDDYSISICDDYNYDKKRTKLLLNALGRVRKVGILPTTKVRYLVTFKLYFLYEIMINMFNKDVVISDNYKVYCPNKSLNERKISI